MGESLIERVRHAAAVAKIELDYNVIENPLNPIFDKKTQKTGTCNAARDGFRQQLAANIYDPVLGPNFEKSKESPYVPPKRMSAQALSLQPLLVLSSLFSRSFLSLLSPFYFSHLSSRSPYVTLTLRVVFWQPNSSQPAFFD